MKKLIAGCAAIAFAPLCGATSWNLGAEWSNDHNPFGQWALYRNPTSVFTTNFPNWLGTGHHAWSQQDGGNDHVPAWLKAEFNNALGLDVYDGAIAMHTAETERTGTEISFARWTSPISGTIYVRGGVWMARKLREQDWFIRHNEAIVTGGFVSWENQYNSQTPLDFSSGSGGASALVMSVEPGDTVDLLLQRIPEHGEHTGDFVGSEFAITTSPDQGSLRGRISFQNYEGDVSQLPVFVTVRRDDGAAVFSKRVQLDAEGDYSIPVCINGDFTVSVQHTHWLKRAHLKSFTDAGAVADFDLINGDVDGDNEITLVDFGQLAAAFGSIEGDPNWNANADLDGDGEVTLVDLSILSTNFGEAGDD